MTSDREAAVRAVLDALVEAWNAGDATAYAGLFTEDADYITFFGRNTPGRRAIEAGHRALFAGPLKGSRLTGGGEPPAIRFIRPDVAVAVSGGGSSLDGEPDPERASTVTCVLVHEGDAWRITSFQNTRRTPVPGEAA
ncbi:SgcJ/EcaC family oxidoreductase [Actinosynnema sp. NPDC059797]